MKLFVIAVISLVTQCEARHVRRSTDANFDIHIVEKNTSYTERVKLDFDKNLEIINVPAHNGVNAMDEMHDMDNGLTVQCLPDLKKCFLIELDRGHVDSLQDQEDSLLALWRKNGLHIEDTSPDSVIVRKNWTVTEGPLQSLDFLRKEMREFIKNRPVYRMKLLPDDAEFLLGGVNPATTSVQKRASRTRRTTYALTTFSLEVQSFLLEIKPNNVGVECLTGQPKFKYGYTGGASSSCDWLMWCDPPGTQCKRQHISNFKFYKCFCCPEHKYADHCIGCKEVQ